MDEAFTFPMPPLVTALFHNRGSGNPSLLWRLFRSAVEGIDTVSDEDFMLAQAICGVAVKKLTQALFLINARQVLPYDDWTLSLGVVEGGRANPVAWNDYRSDLAELLEAFPGCMPYEIDLLAYETRRSDLPLKLDPTRCWQISTNVYNDGMDRWDDFELNNCAYTGGPGKRQGSWREYDAENHELEPTRFTNQGRATSSWFGSQASAAFRSVVAGKHDGHGTRSVTDICASACARFARRQPRSPARHYPPTARPVVRGLWAGHLAQWPHDHGHGARCYTSRQRMESTWKRPPSSREALPVSTFRTSPTFGSMTPCSASPCLSKPTTA